MAKKKAKGNLFDDDDVSNSQISIYGDVVKSGLSVLENLGSYKMLSVSPCLDMELGGGIREGTVVNMTGDPKVGKTTTALHFAAKCQAVGKRVIYINTEGRLERKNFEGIKGLDIEAIRVVESTDDKKLSAEDFLNIIESYIKNQPDVVIIVDSLSVMVPLEELEGEIRTGVRNQLPRLLAMFFKRISGDIARTKSVLVCITHNIADTGRSMRTKMADCGNMLQYQISTNLVATHREMIESTKGNKDYTGQICYWNIKTSSCGKPVDKVATHITYGIGIDESREIIELCTDFSLIKKSGAWYSFPHLTNNTQEPAVQRLISEAEIDPENKEAVEKLFKYQGAAKASKFVEENPDIQELLYKEILSIANEIS